MFNSPLSIYLPIFYLVHLSIYLSILLIYKSTQAKLDALDEEAEKISVTHPEEAVVIKQRTGR